MRIVIDLQPCQNGSRSRGIGRYSMAMTKAIIKIGRTHEFIIVLNETFNETIGNVRSELRGLVDQDAILLFSVPDRTASAEPTNAWRNRTAEMVRSHFLESLRPDLVFIPSLNEGLWDDTVVSVERSAGYPTAVTLYDLIPLEDPKAYLATANDWNAYLRRLNQLRRADLILPISAYVASEGAAKLGLHPDKLVVAHCGVEPNFVPPKQDAIAKARLLESYGITRDYVMAASPFEARKNLDGLIAGFASISRNIRDAHQLVLFGKMNAGARKHLTDLARNEGLPDGVLVLPGFAPDADLPALYHYSTVFAFPSFSEGFGLPLLEAMASGAPVVGSNQTSIPEVIGREDLMCDPADAVAIGRTIERILSQPGLQRELRAFGPSRAAAFTWEKSAAIVLEAFENLIVRRSKWIDQRKLAVSQPAKFKGRTLAFFMPSVPIDHRIAGINNALTSSLADLFDLTVIAEDFTPHSDWVAANITAHNIAWFDINAAKFDHILYGTDIMADASFRKVMTRHRGTSVLIERLCAPSENDLASRQMFDGAQVALFEHAGIGAMATAAEGELSAGNVASILYRDLAERTITVFHESDSCFAESAGQLGILPITRSDSAASAFCVRANIDREMELVVAILSDERTSEEIVRRFREDTAHKSDSALVVFIIGPATKTPLEISKIFGNVTRILGDLDIVYCGLMSAADEVIFDAALPDRIKVRLKIDARKASVFSEHGKGLLERKKELEVADLARDARNKSIDFVDLSGTSAAKDAAHALGAIILWAPTVRVEDATDTFVSRLPIEIRGVHPDSDDLAHVAVSLARNETYAAPNHVYVDITSFAARNSTRRLDLLTRMLLKALFLRGGRRMRAVYADGDRFVVANQFVGRLTSIANFAIPDEEMIAHAGDSILGIDKLDSFQRESVNALRMAQNRGISMNYVVLGSAALDRGDVLLPLANLILTWAAGTDLTPTTRLSALPHLGESPRIIENDNGHLDRIDVLARAGLFTNILLCDGTLGSSFIPKWSVVDLSQRVIHEYEKWMIARAAPPPPGANQICTVANLEHVVTGHILGSYSLAIVNRMIARTIEKRFPGNVRYLPVETVPIDHTEGVPVSEKELMIELANRPKISSRDRIVISHHYPVLVPTGDYKLALAVFFWEESQVPIATIRQLSNNFDAIISPTKVVTNALFNSGVTIPVATIGQPIDIARYSGLSSIRKPKGKKTNFLHVSSCFKRKGVDILLSAWAKAFTKHDDVRLIIKTFPNPHNDVIEQLAALRARYHDLAEIVLVNDDVGAEEMLAFYAEADVMVLPTRGEGYNLPALEAMAAGLPLIVTGYGGHRDFCGEREARLLRYRFANSESHLGSPHSIWVEPDVDDLVAALREQIDPTAFAIIEERRECARLAAAHASDEAVWLARYETMICELQDNSYCRPARVAWVSTWAVQCGIAEYSKNLINNMSVGARSEILVICDNRTQPDAKAPIAFEACWDAQNTPKSEHMLERIDAFAADAVVIQHQDGLLSWEQLGRLAFDSRLANKVSIVVLHNAGTLAGINDDKRKMIVQGLGRLTRVLVHNLADVNFLASLGLEQNVGLFPHGAFTNNQAPWPRSLTASDTPIIGCHGFFFRHKGIDKLIRAGAILRKEWPRLKLRLVNARFPEPAYDAYIHECAQLATSLGMDDAIEWHQDFLPVDELQRLLRQCDLVALPYNESSDSVSGAVRGSISSMVPLVATRVKIFSELGNAAAWAESNDPNELADTIAQLLRSPERRRSVQAAMHEWLEAHDWNIVASNLEGMIHGLVKQKRLGWDFNI